MELDVSGLVCPQPVAVVRRCLAELDPGDELVVVGDYAPAERSIRRTCYRHGFEVGPGPEPDAEEEFSVRIRVTESATLTSEPQLNDESKPRTADELETRTAEE